MMEAEAITMMRKRRRKTRGMWISRVIGMMMIMMKGTVYQMQVVWRMEEDLMMGSLTAVLPQAKWKPLHTLALSGQIQSLDKLLKHGVKINSFDKDGRTALHIAAIGKKDAVISHLLRKGANPRVQDEGGATPLHYAVQVGALQTVKLLIKHGADVNVSDDEGWTPLHVAMQTRNRDVAKALLIHGANKSRENEDGKTPVDICFSYGKDFDTYNLVKLLKMMPAK